VPNYGATLLPAISQQAGAAGHQTLRVFRDSQPARASLQGEHFDVIVIGGGINGVAIARECARHGRRTLLLEQHDFGAGTTSRSTRIIHGGLRYLEHGELGLVRQSLRERQRLLCERPNLVRPLRFLLALPRSGPQGGRSALEIRVGLWLYSQLSGARPQESHRSDAAALENWLDSGRQWSTFSYEDAQCEFPERLVAEWLREAVQFGATVRNYAEALQVRIQDGVACGVVVRDGLRADEASVSASWMINASGPWVDRVCGRAGLVPKTPMIGGLRGSHIVLPNFVGAPGALYSEAVDGRPVFLVPWNGQLLVGTTEVPDQGDPARTAPTALELEYLIGSVNRLFPRAHISYADLRYAFAGVRPLPFTPDRQPSAITRRHRLHHHKAEGAAGLISVVGGKLTTAAALARDCARAIGIPVPEPRTALLAGAACGQMEHSLEQWARTVARTAFGSASESPFIQATKATRIDVELDRNVLYELDGGEREAVKRLKVKVKPDALTVMVPRKDAG
jgi:glycerol-3-phosphate dehydrogenase